MFAAPIKTSEINTEIRELKNEKSKQTLQTQKNTDMCLSPTKSRNENRA